MLQGSSCDTKPNTNSVVVASLVYISRDVAGAGGKSFDSGDGGISARGLVVGLAGTFPHGQ